MDNRIIPVTDADLQAILLVPNEALDRPNPIGAPDTLELALGRDLIQVAERRRRSMPPLAPLTFKQGENYGVFSYDESAIVEAVRRLDEIVAHG